LLGTLLFLASMILRSRSSGCAREDCSCADKSFFGCSEPAASSAVRVNGIGQCIDACKAFHPLELCDWFVFDKGGANENCKLFGPDAKMDDYLSTCAKLGQPLFHKDNTCMWDGDDCLLACDMFDLGCTPCDPNSICNVNYHDTECIMILPFLEDAQVEGMTFETCQMAAVLSSSGSSLTYFTFDAESEVCKMYEGGNRRCYKQVVRHGFSEENIASCQSASLK